MSFEKVKSLVEAYDNAAHKKRVAEMEMQSAEHELKERLVNEKELIFLKVDFAHLKRAIRQG